MSWIPPRPATWFQLWNFQELILGWLRVITGVFVKYRAKFQLPKMHRYLTTLSRNLQSLQSLLKDSRRSHVYAVAILTEMAFEETRDLVQACSRVGVNVPNSVPEYGDSGK